MWALKEWQQGLLMPALTSAGIFKQSMGTGNRVGIGLSYRPARLHSLGELVPWNQFLGSLKVQKIGLLLNNLLGSNLTRNLSLP